MKKIILPSLLMLTISVFGQTNPAITNWLINTTGLTGRHYVNGNPTPIVDAVSANVQTVQYSTNWVYVSTNGIPAYITGPFLDGNPSLATSQNAIFKISLNPVQNTGNPTNTNGGNIGIFINGVALFDYRDGVAWNTSTNSLCGGPGNTPCPGGPNANMPWNRDAIPAEKLGFDCAKGHPAMGNYHHHQNPSAFNLDLTVISNICDIYAADGLYAINANQHSPLIGYAYDGFPIYGAYGYANTNGTGGITRIKSSYQLRTYPNGVRTNGPTVGQVIGNQTFFNGYFKEDYEYVAHPSDPAYLDEHNGRFCVTPEYPNGIYCYFATVDQNWNSAYPYVVGPTFYGTKTGAKVTNITETVTTYTSTSELTENKNIEVKVFPNPSNDVLMVQLNDLITENLTLQLVDLSGKLIDTKIIYQGSTIAYFDVSTLYSGQYILQVGEGEKKKTINVNIGE
jgi:hypothetical protein